MSYQLQKVKYQTLFNTHITEQRVKAKVLYCAGRITIHATYLRENSLLHNEKCLVFFLISLATWPEGNLLLTNKHQDRESQSGEKNPKVNSFQEKQIQISLDNQGCKCAYSRKRKGHNPDLILYIKVLMH